MEVIGALTAVGLNAPSNMFSKAQIERGSADARRILEFEHRQRTERMLRGEG